MTGRDLMPQIAATLTQRKAGSENLLLNSELQQIRNQTEAGKLWCREQDLNLRRLAGVNSSWHETSGSPLPKSRAQPRDLNAWCREQDLNLHAFYGTGS